MISEPIHIIPLTQNHMEKTFTWIQNPEVRSLFLMRKDPTWESHQEYFNKIFTDTNQLWYAIFSKDAHIGNCGIKILSTENKKSTLWIYLGETDYWGKGIGKIVTGLLLEKSFKTLNMQQVVIHVADYNHRAIRMYKSLGFSETPLGSEEEWLNRGCRIIAMKRVRDEKQ